MNTSLDKRKLKDFTTRPVLHEIQSPSSGNERTLGNTMKAYKNMKVLQKVFKKWN